MQRGASHGLTAPLNISVKTSGPMPSLHKPRKAEGRVACSYAGAIPNELPICADEIGAKECVSWSNQVCGCCHLSEYEVCFAASVIISRPFPVSSAGDGAGILRT